MRISDWSSDVCSSDLTQPFDLISKINFRSYAVNLRAILDRLTDAGIDKRRFPAKIGANEQNNVGRFTAGDCGIEVHCRQVRNIIIETGRAAFKPGVAQRLNKRARREHGFAETKINKKERQ